MIDHSQNREILKPVTKYDLTYLYRRCLESRTRTTTKDHEHDGNKSHNDGPSKAAIDTRVTGASSSVADVRGTGESGATTEANGKAAILVAVAGASGVVGIVGVVDGVGGVDVGVVGHGNELDLLFARLGNDHLVLHLGVWRWRLCL